MDRLNGYVGEVDGVNESPGGLVVRIDSGRQLQPSNLAQPAAISMPGLESGPEYYGQDAGNPPSQR
jgi:hypothetical protein